MLAVEGGVEEAPLPVPCQQLCNESLLPYPNPWPCVAGKPAQQVGGAATAGDVAVRGAGVAGSAMRVLDLFGCSLDYDRRGKR